MTGVGGPAQDGIRITFITACHDSDSSSLLYLLQTETAGGLSCCSANATDEQRLFRTQHFHATRMAPNGDLYCIRSPYLPQRLVGVVPFLLDVVTTPVRLMMKIVAIMHVVSVFFNHKPLLTSLGNQRKRNDPMGMVLRSRWIETGKILSKEGDEYLRGLVPDDWVLLHRRADGTKGVLATGGVAFDLSDAGDLPHERKGDL